MASRKKILDNFRINILILGQFVVAGIFIFRLFTIQVIQHEDFMALANEQYWSFQEIPARRGDVLTDDGFPLATTQLSYLLYAQPGKIEDPYQTAYDISGVIGGESRDEVMEKYHELLNLDLVWVALEHNLSQSERSEIEKLGYEGLGFEEEPVRYYPEGSLASHILGFVGKNANGEEQGYYGIEGSLNGDLKGRPGRVLQEIGASGAPILVGGYRRIGSKDGRDVVLTVNRAVQYIVERKLEEGVTRYGASSGSVIVMNPFTGDVISMANYPTYDPSNFNEVNQEEGEYTVERRNLAINDTYEPGSVLKPLTISCAVDLGKVTPQTTFVDSGPVYYSGHMIDNWDGKHHNVQTIIQLLQKSNNIGAAWVGHLVGSKELESCFNKFGIGRLSGIDLEGEDTGILRDYETWTDIDLATAAFGQGVSATPLQVLNAFNAIANGGVLVKPRVISKVIEEDKVLTIPIRKIGRVVSQDTSDTLTDMLIKAVSGGEAKYFVMKDYDIAGKTGTAQIPVEGKYDADQTNATFAGYLANSKKFSMIVRLYKPTTSVYSAETAVPLWMEIADDLIKYYGIPPDTIEY